MRQANFFVTLSLDGYFEGPNHDLSWHNVDDEFNEFVIDQLNEADLFIYGRRTYQLMESYWPNAADDSTTSKENLEIASLLNDTEKIVYSKTLARVEEKKNWKNVRLVREFDPDEIRRLKQEPGKSSGRIGTSCVLYPRGIDRCV